MNHGDKGAVYMKRLFVFNTAGSDWKRYLSKLPDTAEDSDETQFIISVSHLKKIRTVISAGLFEKAGIKADSFVRQKEIRLWKQ